MKPEPGIGILSSNRNMAGAQLHLKALVKFFISAVIELL
jgi:hypothetical protein